MCGLLAALIAGGLMELHAFRGLDSTLASFLGRPSPPVVERGLQMFLILLFSLGIAWTTIDISRLSLKIGVAFAAVAETVCAVWVLNLFGAFFSPFASLVAIVAAFVVGLFYAQSSAGRRKKTLHLLLGDRVSNRMFDALLNSDTPLRFEGEVREASVVVCELFNHDELVAALRIPDYVAMTNAFLRNAADFLVERGGYLDECDGESLRVVFGAPLHDPRHAARSCEAALELAERLDAVNRECQSVWGHRFDFRIGVNSGEMVMAAYGSRRLGAFSVTGEPVEFTRRLCAANTIYGSRILVSAGTFSYAEDAIEVRPMELIQRFRDEPEREEVYELLGRHGTLAPREVERRDTFWKAIVFFRERRWEEALTTFRACAEGHPHDGPVEFYIRRVEQIRAGLPALDFNAAKM
jgi:class 3 adenylate cyclase